MEQKKVAVITGASSGIGYDAMKTLLKHNYCVVGLARNDCKDFENFFVCDVSKKEQVEEIFAKIFDKFGRIDVLINNAGFGCVNALELVKESELKQIFEVNVFGIVYCTNACLKYMKSGSKIINISSACAFSVIPYRALYSATKSAVNDISFGYYMELKNSGIDVCSLCPCEIKTNFSKSRHLTLDTNERYGEKIKRSVEQSFAREGHRVGPEVVSNKIVKLLNKKHMKPLVLIGFKNKAEVFLSKFVSTKTYLNVLNKIFNSDKPSKFNY